MLISPKTDRNRDERPMADRLLYTREVVHRVVVPPPDGKPNTFRWHFPSGALKPRMSARELADFLLGHMPYIVPLLANHQQVQAEFHAMLVLLVTGTEEQTVRLLPWIRSVCRQEDDDRGVRQEHREAEASLP